MPELGTHAQFVIENSILRVLTQEPRGSVWRPLDRDRRTDGKGEIASSGPAVTCSMAFKETRYSVKTDGSLGLSESLETSLVSEVMSSEWERVRMNDDDTTDFLRVRYAGSTSSPYPVTIYEVATSTDGGKTFHTAQCTGAYPRNVLADYNRDGRLDIVTESKQLVEGGLKETLVRGFTRREVDLDVEVRLQDGNGGFPAKPSLRRRFTVTLDKPPAKLSEMFLRFLEGGFLQLRGDIDGDGQNDAVIHDLPDSLSVYRGSATAITNSHIASLPIAPTGVYHVVDVDEDGRADVLIGRAGGERNESASATVYLSRETAR